MLPNQVQPIPSRLKRAEYCAYEASQDSFYKQ